MSTRGLVFISFALVLVTGGVWYVWQERSVSTVLPAAVDPFVAAQAANSGGLSPQAATAAQAAAAQEFPNTYTNRTYGFSFKYPANLKVGTEDSPVNGATTILAQDATQHIGFQVYITPFTDPDPVLTAARVEEGLSGVSMSDAQVAQLGPSSPGLAFRTTDSTFGKSRQVWVVYKQHLYQISSYSSQDVLLQKVLSTWVFTK